MGKDVKPIKRKKLLEPARLTYRQLMNIAIRTKADISELREATKVLTLLDKLALARGLVGELADATKRIHQRAVAIQELKELKAHEDDIALIEQDIEKKTAKLREYEERMYIFLKIIKEELA